MVAESDQADVIVIGGGGSGLAAASQAASLGRRVILLEKNPRLGGSAGWSIGSVSATNTPHQLRAGIQDTPDEHFDDLGLFAGAMAQRDNLVLRRILVDNATSAFEWLLSTGVVFLGPMPEAPHRYPRMHNVVPSSKAYPYHLGRHCRKLGVDIRLSMTARSFITEEGRVVGVQAQDQHGREHSFRARRGVVLTTGDYSGSQEFKKRFASPIAADCGAVNVTNTGDGHAMAIALGARVVNGDVVHGPIMRFVPPKSSSLLARIPPMTWVGRIATFALAHVPHNVLRPLLMSFVTTALGPDPGLYRAGAILVNAQGHRFTDELEKPGHALVGQPGGDGYIVFDRPIAQQFTAWPNFISTAPSVAYAYLQDYRRSRRAIFHEAPSVEALAGQLGMPPHALAAALAAGRPGGRPLAEPPFFALGPIRSYVVLTDGGLAVSERHEVLGDDGAPIAGLFAAGSAGQGGLLLFGHGHHLAWAFVSGRLAGRNAALLHTVT